MNANVSICDNTFRVSTNFTVGKRVSDDGPNTNGIGAIVHDETMSFLRKTIASVNSAILTSKQCT